MSEPKVLSAAELFDDLLESLRFEGNESGGYGLSSKEQDGKVYVLITSTDPIEGPVYPTVYAIPSKVDFIDELMVGCDDDELDVWDYDTRTAALNLFESYTLVCFDDE